MLIDGRHWSEHCEEMVCVIMDRTLGVGTGVTRVLVVDDKDKDVDTDTDIEQNRPENANWD